MKRQHPAEWADTGERCRARWCDCGAAILTGYDADRVAFLAHTDTQPISAIGELIAINQNRRTYQLEPRGKGYALTRRAAWAISAKPAGATRPGITWDVVAQHVCGADPLPATQSNLTQPEATATPTDTLPPF